MVVHLFQYSLIQLAVAKLQFAAAKFHLLWANLGYVHTKPDKFENATFAVKTDRMFSVHINVSVFKKFRFRCPH